MRLVLAAVLLSSVAAPAVARSVHQFGGLALSAKGDRIATVEATGDHGAITIRSVSNGRIERTIDPCKTCGYSDLTWGPDGSLAFLARDRKAGTLTLSLDRGGSGAGATSTVASIPGIGHGIEFSPDGKRIAMLVTIGAAKESGATQAGVRQIGEIGEKSDEQQLAVFDLTGTPVSGGAIKPISPADRYVYEFDWTPDGTGFVATTAIGNGDNNWWVATLDAIDATTGAVRQIAKPATQLNFPRVSPDGKTVAYIGGLMSDFGSVGGDIWTVPFTGGTPVNATEGAKETATSVVWLKDGLRATTLKGDSMRIVDVSTTGGFGSPLWSRTSSISAGEGRAAYSADGKVMAAVVQDYTHPPAIFAGPVKKPKQITRDNDDVKPIVSARSITWKNDGFDVQGWLLAPAGADKSAKAPMITIVHGGPAAANVPGFANSGALADMVGGGYYIFLPNPRGSYGQGEAFTAANKRDFGGGDLRDILTGIDAVEKVAPVDDARLGLTGGSYGGFMAMWANTQTNRFKGIVAGAGLSNWVSYYGTNGIDQWMLPFFGKTLYEDRAAYEAVSAINFMTKAKTPTFIYVGERDIEVPPTQSIEYWHALKDLGVPTTLVIYPDEGHGIRAPANSADVRKRTVAWFDKYVKGAE